MRLSFISSVILLGVYMDIVSVLGLLQQFPHS